MRRFDKKINIEKANLLNEQRYLKSKVVLKENINEGPIGSGTVPSNNELQAIKNEIKNLKTNFTINNDALLIPDLNLEITYNVDSKIYQIRDRDNGKYYVNNIIYTECKDCKFKSHDEVVKFINHKNSGGKVKYMP